MVDLPRSGRRGAMSLGTLSSSYSHFRRFLLIYCLGERERERERFADSSDSFSLPFLIWYPLLLNLTAGAFLFGFTTAKSEAANLGFSEYLLECYPLGDLCSPRAVFSESFLHLSNPEEISLFVCSLCREGRLLTFILVLSATLFCSLLSQTVPLLWLKTSCTEFCTLTLQNLSLLHTEELEMESVSLWSEGGKATALSISFETLTFRLLSSRNRYFDDYPSCFFQPFDWFDGSYHCDLRYW